MLAVFIELRSWKTVHFSNQLMSMNKYAHIFLLQIIVGVVKNKLIVTVLNNKNKIVEIEFIWGSNFHMKRALSCFHHGTSIGLEKLNY